MLSSISVLAAVLVVHSTLFPSHIAKPIAKTVTPQYFDDDDFDWGSSRKAAIEAARCDTLWREQGLDRLPHLPPAPGKEAIKGGSPQESAAGYGTEAEGRAGYSLEDEIKSGKSRKQALQEMVGKTKGYYVRDYSLYVDHAGRIWSVVR